MDRVHVLVTAVASVLALAALAMSTATLVQPQPRYGYTDASELLAAYPPAAEAREAIATELAPMRSKITEQGQLVDEAERRLTAEAGLSDTERAFLAQRVEIAKLRQAQLELQLGRLEDRLETERMAPIHAHLDERMRAFGQAEGYTLIWAATRSGNLAYASDAANVTDEFVAWMAANPGA